jgi:hypothetical protein
MRELGRTNRTEIVVERAIKYWKTSMGNERDTFIKRCIKTIKHRERTKMFEASRTGTKQIR